MNKICYNNDAEVFIVDSETQNLSLHRYVNKPWEISYALYKGKKKVLERQRFIWWEGLNVGKEAAQITRFDYNYYKDRAEDPKVVWKDLKEFLYDSEAVIVGHNLLSFDIFQFKILAQEVGDWKGFDGFINRVYDTLCLSKAYLQGLSIDSENLLASQLKFSGKPPKGIKCSLGAMAKHFNIEYDTSQAHSALYDIMVNYQVFNQLAYKMNL